jgi:hypothetical protein
MHDEQTLINLSNTVRSPNEQSSERYEKIKYLARQVLGEYANRGKAKIIQDIKRREEIDDIEAEALFYSMLEYEFIYKLESAYYYLAESVPYWRLLTINIVSSVSTIENLET